MLAGGSGQSCFLDDPFGTYQGGIDVGQCTWYAAGMRPDLDGITTGNASAWLAEAKGKLPEGTRPVVGAIAVNTTADYGIGHVAYVVGVNGTELTLDEANIHNNGGVFLNVQTPASAFSGYIYGGPAGPGPSASGGGGPSAGGTGTGATSGPTYPETTGSIVNTWSDYADAGGNEGQPVLAHDTVKVSCKATGFSVPDGNSWWYLVASGPWSGNFFASADAFYNNGETSGSLQGTPFVDLGVPSCAGSTGTPSPPGATTTTLPTGKTLPVTTTTLSTTTTTQPTTTTTRSTGPGAWSEVLESDAYSAFCTSAASCIVVGLGGDVSTYTASGWRAFQPPQSWEPQFQIQVSCPTAQFCMVLDGAGNTHVFNGSAWSQAGEVDQTYEDEGMVTPGISCASSQFCLMVDQYGDDAVYNGSGWTEGNGIPGLSQYNGMTGNVPDVSCVSADFCAVVSDSGVAYLYQDGGWYTDIIDPDAAESPGYAGLSCPAPGSCVAMEDNGDVVTLSNGSWGAPVHIDSDPAISAAFVSCASASYCVAVDNDGNTFVDNGTGWVPVTSNAPSGPITSLSCPSPGFCAATNNNGQAFFFRGAA